MRIGILAAALLTAGFVLATAASAKPMQDTSTDERMPSSHSDTEMADASRMGLRGSHDALDDGSQPAQTATAGPRRLSALAGSDEQAWASARSIKAIPWRHARKLRPH